MICSTSASSSALLRIVTPVSVVRPRGRCRQTGHDQGSLRGSGRRRCAWLRGAGGRGVDVAERAAPHRAGAQEITPRAPTTPQFVGARQGKAEVRPFRSSRRWGQTGSHRHAKASRSRRLGLSATGLGRSRGEHVVDCLGSRVDHGLELVSVDLLSDAVDECPQRPAMIPRGTSLPLETNERRRSRASISCSWV